MNRFEYGSSVRTKCLARSSLCTKFCHVLGNRIDDCDGGFGRGRHHPRSSALARETKDLFLSLHLGESDLGVPADTSSRLAAVLTPPEVIAAFLMLLFFSAHQSHKRLDTPVGR